MVGSGSGREGFAAELARRRAEAGLSLADVAAAAHVARGYVHHVERGRRWPSQSVARALDSALAADGALATVWERGNHAPGKPTPRRAPGVQPVEPMLAAAGAVGALPVDVMALRAMAQAFQIVDRQVGGGRLYPAVLRFLHTEIAPTLVDPRGVECDELFAAAASLTELAGWMAHDCGVDGAARNHFGRAYRLALAADSSALTANVCASMAHLAAQLGHGADAVRIAQAGLDRAAVADGVAWLVARLHAMRAHGLALDRQVRSAAAALDAAEDALAAAAGTEPAEWIAGFDEGALASEAALCRLGIGDLAGAERAALRVIELRDGDRVRSRAFGQLTLARVLVCASRPDEAATLGCAVCEVVPSLTSARVRVQLAGLGETLRPHCTAGGVADFLDQLATLPPGTAAGNRESTWPV